jgi:hypothetical protein
MKMENLYNELMELTSKGTIERKVSVRKGDVIVQESGDRIPKILTDATWEIENFFLNNDWIAERYILTLNDGSVYEDRVNIYEGFKKIK